MDFLDWNLNLNLNFHNLPLGININMVGVIHLGKNKISINYYFLPKPGNVSKLNQKFAGINLEINRNIAPHDSAEPDTTIITIPDQTSNEVSIDQFFAAMPLEA
ncbi:MAG: hypothetical protein Ct9H300mP29_5480 [Candidatus Neomarinimicrobiota bacterium]|nr:MAG: hypothetical protein Ct9H300mP29_5480 [Candidatus Neomarinimicrobiota bacterium]